MSVLNFLGSIIPTLSSNYILIKFMNEVYEKKYDNKYYWIAYWLIVFVQSIVSFIKKPILSLTLFIGIVITLAGVGYKSTSKNKIIYTTIYIIYITFLDMVIVPMYAYYEQTTAAAVMAGEKGYFITGIVSAIIGICTYKIVIRFITKSKVRLLTKGQELFVLFLGCFELLMVHTILQVENYGVHESNAITMLLIAGFLIVDVYVIGLFEYVSRQNELKMHTCLLEQQEMMNVRYLEELEIQNDKYRKIMHDIRGHLYVMKNLQKVDEDYYKEILQIVEGQGMKFRCSNPVLTVIFNDRIFACEAKGIEFILDIEDVDFSFMQKTDIATIFMNLINNAVEACEEVEPIKRRIKVTVREIQGNIVVVITNSCKDKQLDYQEGISKKDGHMGLGIANVKAVLERYESELYLECKEYEFCAKFVIFK